MLHENTGGDHRDPTPNSYITIHQVQRGGLGGGNSRYVANSLQCNGYGNESVVVEVVI